MAGSAQLRLSAMERGASAAGTLILMVVVSAGIPSISQWTRETYRTWSVEHRKNTALLLQLESMRCRYRSVIDHHAAF